MTPIAHGCGAAVPGFLGRLADVAQRRRGRVVVAWIVALAATLVLAPRVAGEFDAEYATPGSESKAAAEFLAERFPGTSGDTIDVVWKSPRGVRGPAVAAEMNRFLEQASRLEGVGDAGKPEVSDDGRIAVARLELDRPSWDVPGETTSELIGMAKAAGDERLQVEIGGVDDEGGSPELWASSQQP